MCNFVSVKTVSNILFWEANVTNESNVLQSSRYFQYTCMCTCKCSTHFRNMGDSTVALHSLENFSTISLSAVAFAHLKVLDKVRKCTYDIWFTYVFNCYTSKYWLKCTLKKQQEWFSDCNPCFTQRFWKISRTWNK